MKIIDGKQLAKDISLDIQNQLQSVQVIPHLAIIQVGEEQASNVYIKNKQELASQLGIRISLSNFENGQENEIESTIQRLNIDQSVHAIIIQLPTPGIISNKLLEMIDPKKDVDGLTSFNLGKVWHGEGINYAGATPRAIFHVLEYISSDINTTIDNFLLSKNILIINHSVLIGKPLAGILSNYNSTVSIANEYTKELDDMIIKADIIITATGTSTINFNNSKLLKPGVVIIDSGYKFMDGKSHGDVEIDSIKDIASYVTPVPGGIGPIGVAMLMKNTMERSFIV